MCPAIHALPFFCWCTRNFSIAFNALVVGYMHTSVSETRRRSEHKADEGGEGGESDDDDGLITIIYYIHRIKNRYSVYSAAATAVAVRAHTND